MQMRVLNMHARRAAMVVTIGALTATLAPPALAQTVPDAAPGSASASAKPAGTVVVTGTKGSAEPDRVIAAKSKVLSRNYASSCAFMASPNAAEDDVALAYMRDFGMDGGISDDAEHFSVLAPDGNVKDARDPSSLTGLNDPAGDPSRNGLATPSIKCGSADRRFAAGRQQILQKDKSLAEGFVALDARDYPRALQLLSSAWNKIGYDEAGLALAKMHLYGMGTPKDTGQAIVWLRKVADGRFDPMRERMKFNPKEPQLMSEKVEAAFMLARIYERGIGMPKNPAQALTWYAKAAEFGFVPAQNVLGQACVSGYGIAPDGRKAVGYLQTAAEKGYVPAQYNLAKVYYNGDAGVARDLKQAGAWFNTAAKAGYPAALFAAGRMYDMGEGVAADQKRAIVYYKEAAVKGDRDAEFALATFFYDGEVVEKNRATARKLFEAAAKQGQVDAMLNLGAMELNGDGGPADLAMAYVWLNLAKQAGHPQADAALKAVAPKLSAQDRARADQILKPTAKS
jgi:TPR repeat protein